jgi:hypothetical protein
LVVIMLPAGEAPEEFFEGLHFSLAGRSLFLQASGGGYTADFLGGKWQPHGTLGFVRLLIFGVGGSGQWTVLRLGGSGVLVDRLDRGLPGEEKKRDHHWAVALFLV